MRGEIDHADSGLVGSGVVGLVVSLHAIPSEVLTTSRHVMANSLIDELFYGLFSAPSRGAAAAGTPTLTAMARG